MLPWVAREDGVASDVSSPWLSREIETIPMKAHGPKAGAITIFQTL